MAAKIPVGANVFIILFDINTSAKQEALSFLSKVLYVKQLSESKDIGKVYLFNTDQGVTFLNIDEMKVDAVLAGIQNFDVGEDNFLEALQTGIDELKNFYGTSASTLQLLLITDFENCKNDKEKISDDLIHDLNEHEIFLYIIGPNIRPNKMLLNEKDLEAWKEAIPEQTDKFQLNKALKLIKATRKAVISDFELGIHLFNSYKYAKGMQPWNVPLAIGSRLELTVSTIRITKEEAPFKIRKSTQRHLVNKWVLEDEEDKEVEQYDIICGVVRHGKFVKIDTDEMFKAENPKCFSLLGFTDQVNIPEYYFQCEASYMVVPDLTQPEEHTELFSILVDELAKAKLYGLARKVYSTNNEPKILALIPRPDMKVKCFLLFELPYADDVAYSYEESDFKSAPKVVKDEDVYNFLDSINISGTKSVISPGIGPRLMFDPSCIEIIKKVEEKMFGRQSDFVKKELIPSKNEEKLFEKYLDCWPQREIVKVMGHVNANPFDDNLDDFTFDD